MQHENVVRLLDFYKTPSTYIYRAALCYADAMSGTEEFIDVVSFSSTFRVVFRDVWY